ncbi:bifunctional DNA-formamidopyrimidine glycosylase/DNA-(apurinic or apyrimidinic site) lyase [Mycoplasmopsis iners]|uniref:bifunctional DNA-formamidopyrimidine glycosylase/DNA-(apurinic or apyrimidinic site) lyase n=1 Tax=Mycoplasmopsis iners TaxID=76630 RepID=UPI0004959162|nr:bifunctional DNA-formamidopyrimidine glycosylase/DNA-(apurinic or apyrimidinic site) lyase [Mycoplasmopsis iners]
MPEMPEVITVVKGLNDKVAGKQIENIELFHEKMLKNASPEEFKNFLIGETILSISNLGKYIIFNLTNDKFLVSHLRMTGKYNTYKKRRSLEPHDYVVFSFTDQSCLYYNDARQFGTFDIKTKETLLTTLPLSKLAKIPSEIDIDALYDQIKNRRITVKAFLLDQTLILGVGNIYANEALWNTKIHPETKICNLTKSKINELVKKAGEIMDLAIKQGGSSIQSYTSVDGVKGNFQNFLKVHMRENEPCARCQSRIVKIFVNQRGTYLCPNCQKI